MSLEPLTEHSFSVYILTLLRCQKRESLLINQQCHTSHIGLVLHDRITRNVHSQHYSTGNACGASFAPGVPYAPVADCLIYVPHYTHCVSSLIDTDGADYIGGTFAGVFEAYSSTDRVCFQVLIINDEIIESSETFSVSLEVDSLPDFQTEGRLRLGNTVTTINIQDSSE